MMEVAGKSVVITGGGGLVKADRPRPRVDCGAAFPRSAQYDRVDEMTHPSSRLYASQIPFRYGVFI
jgi:hypothetical protein